MERGRQGGRGSKEGWREAGREGEGVRRKGGVTHI